MAPVQSSRAEEIPLIEKHHVSIYIKQINLKRAANMETQGKSDKTFILSGDQQDITPGR